MMSVFYCVTDKSLRHQSEQGGILAGQDAGFFLLSDEPELDVDRFDLWEVALSGVQDTGLPQIIRESISPLLLNRVEPSHHYAMAI
jgi:hypothetical protein